MKLFQSTKLTAKEIRDRSPEWIHFINNLDRLKMKAIMKNLKNKSLNNQSGETK